MEVDKAATKDQFHALSNQKVSISYYMMMMSVMMVMEMMTLIMMRMMDDDDYIT